MENKRRYTKGEEIANSIIHGVGIVFGIVFISVLLYLSLCLFTIEKPLYILYDKYIKQEGEIE